MREIKFKIWDKKNKRWYIQYPNCNNLFNVYKDGTLGRKSEDDDYIFVEYTGLKDKNGKEIYEGGIVKVNCGDYFDIGKVVFNHGGFYLPGFVPPNVMPPPHDCEIIGNEFENPELLEKK